MAAVDIISRVMESRLGPNRYCIAGAALGLIAVLLPWVGVESRYWGFSFPPGYDLSFSLWVGIREFSALDLLQAAYPLGIICALFLVGTLMALVSPVGGIPQMFGVLGFAFRYDSASLLAPFGGTYSGDPMIGIGFWLGVVSTMMVIQAPMKSMLLANNGKPVRMLGRFAALSPRTISSWK